MPDLLVHALAIAGFAVAVVGWALLSVRAQQARAGDPPPPECATCKATASCETKREACASNGVHAEPGRDP